MKIALFYHSLLSDWNHGNAHFLRGICRELLRSGHDVRVFEPKGAWSLSNLLRDHGDQPLVDFMSAYPDLASVVRMYDPDEVNLDEVLREVDLVLVHEWNSPQLVSRIGEHRVKNAHYRLLFHDTHHRMITDPESMSRFDLTHYDGVLAFGSVIADLYRARGFNAPVWTWHEAADISQFHPDAGVAECDQDLVWIGNWGDGERSEELREFLLEPSSELGLNTAVYGVRYPEEARAELKRHGVKYRGWTANFKAPGIFAHSRFTVHVPRRPYVENLPGIPTIRVFEAMACGIPLVSAPWEDREELFPPGSYLIARDKKEMKEQMSRLQKDGSLREELSQNGLECIRERHTCAHRVEELLEFVSEVRT